MKNFKLTLTPTANLLILFLAVLVSILYSCSDNKIELKNYKEDYNYYPVRLGTSWDYDIDSFIFHKDLDILKIDTINYKVREVITDSFRLNDKLVYRIEKSERSDLSHPWEIRAVYSTQFEGNQIYRTEENQKFIKLSFPLQNEKRWDANTYINKDSEVYIGGESIKVFKEWESRSHNLNNAYFNGLLNFDSTATIELTNKETLIDIRQGYEVYARNYGLIYRYLKVLDTQCNGDPNSCKGISWEQKAEKGFIVIQRLTSYKW